MGEAEGDEVLFEAHAEVNVQHLAQMIVGDVYRDTKTKPNPALSHIELELFFPYDGRLRKVKRVAVQFEDDEEDEIYVSK